MITLLRNQIVPPKLEQYWDDSPKLRKLLSFLSPINNQTGLGDCVEVNFEPSFIRHYDGSFIIRRIEKQKWRIWKKK